MARTELLQTNDVYPSYCKPRKEQTKRLPKNREALETDLLIFGFKNKILRKTTNGGTHYRQEFWGGRRAGTSKRALERESKT